MPNGNMPKMKNWTLYLPELKINENGYSRTFRDESKQVEQQQQGVRNRCKIHAKIV
jgi:hypothetical protein